MMYHVVLPGGEIIPVEGATDVFPSDGILIFADQNEKLVAAFSRGEWVRVARLRDGAKGAE